VTRPTPGPRRRSTPRAVLAAAFLTLAALITLDCLNLIQSEAWVDLTQAPHLNAINHTKPSGVQKQDSVDVRGPVAAVVPVAIVLVVVSLILGLEQRVSTPRSARHRFRRRLRAPPALRFNGTRL